MFYFKVSTAAASGLFGTGTKSVSSLVRFALSSNFPSGLLNTAQSYPTLNLGGGPPISGNQPTGGVPTTVSMSETDQVSLEEFLESCRATSLLAELEDDEDLPEADDDDIDDEANEDDDDYDENYDEEGFEPVMRLRNTSSLSSSTSKKINS